MNSISKLWRKLRTKEYRDGYTEAQLSIEVPFQIRALRKARGWTQDQLAERCGIPQARISHIEQPGRDPLSLRTLYRLSAAFDVGLLVQFVSFSELVHHEAAFDPNTFSVPSFEEDRPGTVSSTTPTSVTLLSLGTDYTLDMGGIARPSPDSREVSLPAMKTPNTLGDENAEHLHTPTQDEILPIGGNNFSTTERTHYDYETHATG